MWQFDSAKLARQLVRALRGPKRSQTALSRRLGYRSNVVYSWESGRRFPTASEFFRVVGRVGVDVEAAMAHFLGRPVGQPLTDAQGVAAFLRTLRGDARIVHIAARCEASRFSTSRWLKGESEPRLPELLRLIEAMSFRVVDFIASLTPPQTVPLITESWRELEARRAVAFTHPWSQAVLRGLEVVDYQIEPAKPRGWLGERLGLTAEREAECLDALVEAGLIRWDGERFQSEPVAVDTSAASVEQRRALKLHWAQAGQDHIERGADGLFSWSVFSLSRADFRELQKMHVRYFHALRQLVDGSTPTEVVAVANVQLFELSGSSERPSD